MPVKRKTVSVSRNTLPSIFRAVAEILEEDTELAESLRSEMLKKIIPTHRERSEVNGFFDAKVTPQDIRNRLQRKSAEELASVVRSYALDPARALSKESDKQKILDFIIERRSSLLGRYRGFEFTENG